MIIKAESKFEVGQYVRYGHIISEISGVYYSSSKGFTYQVHTTSYNGPNLAWVEESKLKLVQVLGDD